MVANGVKIEIKGITSVLNGIVEVFQGVKFKGRQKMVKKSWIDKWITRNCFGFPNYGTVNEKTFNRFRSLLIRKINKLEGLFNGTDRIFKAAGKSKLVSRESVIKIIKGE